MVHLVARRHMISGGYFPNSQVQTRTSEEAIMGAVLSARSLTRLPSGNYVRSQPRKCGTPLDSNEWT